MKISKNFRKGCVLALAGLLAIPCLSLMRTQAAGEIDVDARCSLTVSVDKTVLMEGEAAGNETLLQYKDDFAKVEIPVSIYRVAQVDAVGKYTGIDAFQGMDFTKLSSETTAADWMTLAEEAKGLLDGAQTKPEAAGTEHVKTAGSGSTATATFTDLDTGLYLVVPEATFNEMYTAKYVFTPYLTALPGNPYATGGGTGDDAYGTGEDRWEYDTTIGLKAAVKPQVGKLIVTKTLSNFNETLGRVSFVFEIIGRDTDGTVVYQNIISTTHDTADTQSVTENIPAGCYVTVTEVYDGPSYTYDSPTIVSDLYIWSDAAIEAKEKGEGGAAIENAAIPVAPFVNRYDEGNRGGYGVTNQFERDEDGGWEWTTSIPVTPAPEAE